jgi:diguanylate cyclase (GGDEF)-like protein/PAS domain S-box-containing protein
MRLARKDIVHVLLPPCAVVFLLFVSFFAHFLPFFEKNFLKNRQETVRELTGTAWSVLKYYADLEERGELDREQAQERAMAVIRELRYGDDNKNYFWINDMEPVLLMHPYRTDLEGRNVSEFADPDGQRLFSSFVRKVRAEGAGYVSYLWQWQDDETRIVPKISYVKGFAKWGWIIGTGIYINDLQEESLLLSRSLVLYSIPIFLTIFFISFYIVRHGLKITEKYRRAEELVRKHSEQLEELVDQRTRQLAEANENLTTEVEKRRLIQHQMEMDHTFLSNVIESLPFPFYVIDTKSYAIMLANSKACDKGEGIGERCYELTHGISAPCKGEDHLCPLKEVVRTLEPVKTEHLHLGKNGRKIFVEVHGYPIFDDKGEVIQMIEFALDITDKKELEEKLRQASITDSLTGLYNRSGFMLMAEKQLKLADRLENRVYLLFADLDNMKQINDTYGHDVGDQALIAAARALRENLREADVVGRLGGDEFAAFLTNRESGIDDKTILSRLEEYLAKVNTGNAYPFQISLSYGIVAAEGQPPPGLDELLSKADARMYEMKKKKKQQEGAAAK